MQRNLRWVAGMVTDAVVSSGLIKGSISLREDLPFCVEC